MANFNFFSRGGAPMRGVGGGLPFFFKRLALYAEICEKNPPGIDFPNKMFAVMYLILFFTVFAAFVLLYRFLIIISLLLLIYAFAYNVYILKIARAARLSQTKSRLFSAFVIIVAAAAGLFVRYLLFK